MGWLEAVVLGIVQGLTEFLPVSSSAHLRIVAAIAGWQDPGAAFTAVTQLGTETAVGIYFRREIWTILRTWALSLRRPELRSDPAARMGWYVIIGTIPIAVLGVLFQNAIESTFRDLRLIGTTLVVFGLVLGFVDIYSKKTKSLDELTTRDGLLFGLAQALALVPGVSRSGGTISGGLLLGYTRAAAARYSFLLAIPAVFASGLFELRKIGTSDDPGTTHWPQTVLATVLAFAVGYAVIAWFLRYISSERHSFAPFVGYRVVVGLLVILLVAVGAIPARDHKAAPPLPASAGIGSGRA